MTNVSGMSVLDFLPIFIFELMFPQLRCSLLPVICHGVVAGSGLTAVCAIGGRRIGDQAILCRPCSRSCHIPRPGWLTICHVHSTYHVHYVICRLS